MKRALLARFGLDAPGQWARPIIGMVSRMVDQKGLDIIQGAVKAGSLQALDALFVILGTGTPEYEGMWRGLADAYPDRVAVALVRRWPDLWPHALVTLAEILIGLTAGIVIGIGTSGAENIHAPTPLAI